MLRLTAALTMYRERGLSGLVAFVEKANDTSLVLDIMPFIANWSVLVRLHKELGVITCTNVGNRYERKNAKIVH